MQPCPMNEEQRRLELHERMDGLRAIRVAATKLMEIFNAQKHHLSPDEQIEYSSSFICDQTRIDQAIEDAQIALDCL